MITAIAVALILTGFMTDNPMLGIINICLGILILL